MVIFPFFIHKLLMFEISSLFCNLLAISTIAFSPSPTQIAMLCCVLIRINQQTQLEDFLGIGHGRPYRLGVLDYSLAPDKDKKEDDALSANEDESADVTKTAS